MKYFLLLQVGLLLFLLTSCRNDKSKKEFKFAVKVCYSVYVETYNIYGSGAYGGDIHSNYITDSVDFRMFVGTYDNYSGGYAYSCNGDSIIVEKKSKDDKGITKIIEKRILNLTTLE